MDISQWGKELLLVVIVVWFIDWENA